MLGRDTAKDEEGYRAVFIEHCAFSVSDGSGKVLGHYLKASWLEKQVAQFQRLRSKWPKLPGGYDCQKKHFLMFLNPPRQRPKSWNSIDHLVVLLGRNLQGHPSADFFWEGKSEAVIYWSKGMGKSTNMGMSFTCTQSSDYSHRFMRMILKKWWVPCGECCKKKATSKTQRHGSSVGCTRREAKVYLQAVQSQTRVVQKDNNDKGG